MEYLLKASAVIGIFYICYKLFLQRETFFQSNRWFLLTGLIAAFTIPLIVIPIYVSPISEQLQNVMIYGNTIPNTMSQADTPIDILQLTLSIYLIGSLLFLVRFILQFGSLGFLLLNNNREKRGKYIYIKTNSTASPFSFFKWIVYNPNQFSTEELEQIITHEKIHAGQYHSIDIILTQLASIIFWFNPLIWFYKKELQQNLEFIADQNTQDQFNCKKSYQHLLLKTSVPNYEMALTNNFYNSLIKKRIVMLHKNRSQNKNQWKYALVLPVLGLFLMSFNTKEVIKYSEETISQTDNMTSIITKDLSNDDLNNIKSKFLEDDIIVSFDDIKRNKNNELIKLSVNLSNSQEKSAATWYQENNTIPNITIGEQNGKLIATSNVTIVKEELIEVIITKDFTENDFKKVKEKFAKLGVTLKFNGIKRNKDNEIIAIKTEFKTPEGSSGNSAQKGNKPITPFVFYYNQDSGEVGIGGNHSEAHQTHAEGYVYETKKGHTKVFTSKKGNNVFVHSSSGDHDDKHEIIESDGKIIIKSGNKVHEIKKSHKHKSENVFVISDHDNGAVLELKDSIRFGNKHVNKIRIVKDGQIIKEHKDKDGNINVWTGDDDGTLYEIRTTGKKDKNKLSFYSKDGKEPIFILDGKEVSKKKIDKLSPDAIASVSVLKGKSATEKYGKKAKDGVIIITSKDKK